MESNLSPPRGPPHKGNPIQVEISLLPVSLPSRLQCTSQSAKRSSSLGHFCDTLDIPFREEPEWYAEFHPPTARLTPFTPSRIEPMETQDHRYCSLRLPSETRSQQSALGPHQGSSSTKAQQNQRDHCDCWATTLCYSILFNTTDRKI